MQKSRSVLDANVQKWTGMVELERTLARPDYIGRAIYWPETGVACELVFSADLWFRLRKHPANTRRDLGS